MIYRKGVFVVVYRREKSKIKYLVLKRKLHWKGWEFPKGGIERKESLMQAMKRELREETGLRALKIKIYKLAGKYKYDKNYKDRKGFLGQTWKLYSAGVGRGEIKLDKKEHSGYKWLEFEKALKILTWGNQKRGLKIVNKRLE